MLRLRSAAFRLALIRTAGKPNQLLCNNPPLWSLALQHSFSHRVQGSGSDYGRKVLPPELISRCVVPLECDSTAKGGVCDVYLVGTVHLLEESCQEVQAVIDFLKPQVVFLELEPEDIGFLRCKDLRVDIGMHRSEFCVAYDEAMKYGSKVVLGDVPRHITLQRLRAKTPLWQKIILSIGLLLILLRHKKRSPKEMDDMDIDLLLEKISMHFPIVVETLVHERDQYMSAGLLRVSSKHNSVVAVVGKGHLPGIKKYWKQHVNMEQLITIPSKTRGSKILTTIGYTVAGVAIISCICLTT